MMRTKALDLPFFIHTVGARNERCAAPNLSPYPPPQQMLPLSENAVFSGGVWDAVLRAGCFLLHNRVRVLELRLCCSRHRLLEVADKRRRGTGELRSTGRWLRGPTWPRKALTCSFQAGGVTATQAKTAAAAFLAMPAPMAFTSWLRWGCSTACAGEEGRKEYARPLLPFDFLFSTALMVSLLLCNLCRPQDAGTIPDIRLQSTPTNIMI